MTDWWKLLCCSCGSDSELLTNKFARVFCRPCLSKWEDFNEAENELSADISESGAIESDQGGTEVISRTPVEQYYKDCAREAGCDENDGDE